LIKRIIVAGCADFRDVISVMMIELQEGGYSGERIRTSGLLRPRRAGLVTFDKRLSKPLARSTDGISIQGRNR
jgi:hypothetical protein